MRKVLVVTMPRTPNYGSVLQAYATQFALEKHCFVTCELLDFYKDKVKTRNQRQSLANIVYTHVTSLLKHRWMKGFQKFIDSELHLTKPYYGTESLYKNIPRADVYMTGSDQTFSPVYGFYNPAFFCEFVPNESSAKIVSYAASFAVSSLPEDKVKVYRERLARYSMLTLREESGVHIVRSLLGSEAFWCCDPTLLLSCAEWMKLAEKSRIKVGCDSYILVYILGYMANPFPQADEVIRQVQKKLGLKVVYLSGRKQDYFKRNSSVYKNASPYDFVKLFLNASFIITDSFHGTIFSLIAKKQFLSFATRDDQHDNRVRSLLSRVGALDHLIATPVEDNFIFDQSRYAFESYYSKKAEDFRNYSLKLMMKMVQI